jgi:hypothetical protein
MKKLKLLLVLFALLVGTTASWAKTDVTATYLKDADLSSLEGWGNPGNTAWVTDGAVNVVEFWNWSNQFSFTQVAKLPAGYYRLAVNAFYRNSWGGDGTNNNMAWILAGSKTQNVIALNSMSDLAGYAGSNDLYHAATAFSQGKFSNEFDFNVTGEGTTEVEIGFKGTCPNGGWCILGPVTLYEYTAADYIDDYRAKVTEAEALYETPMYGDDLVALKAAIVEEETLTTVDDVTSAINTLSTAINDALNSISKYAVDKADFDAIKGAADAIIAVDYTETSSGSHSTFESAIATQNNAANGAANADAMKIAISNLKEAIKAYIAGAEPKNDGEFFDVTCLMVNPDFDNNDINGWTKESTLNPNTRIQCNEFYGSAAFDFYQTITGLPNGSYTLSMRAFQRPGWYDGVYADYANGINNATAKIYVNSDESDVMNIMAEMNDTRIYTDPAGEDHFNSDKQPQNAPGFIPNSMEGAAAWFAAGKYLTEVAALVEDGTLRLGFKDGAHSGDVWTLFDEFRLHYYGSSKMIYYKQYLPQLIAEVDADKSNALYANVTGKELDDLDNALGVDATDFTSEKQYSDAINAIKDAQTAYRAAYPSYNALVEAKNSSLTKISTNLGTGVFQYNETTNNSLFSEYETAKAKVSSYNVSLTSTATEIQLLVDALNNAIYNYNNQELNAPAVDKHYSIVVTKEGHAKNGNAIVLDRVAEYPVMSDKYVTNNTGFTLSASAAPNANLAQACVFTAVNGKPNTYNITMERVEGIVYLTYGSLNDSKVNWKDSQIQATMDSSKKGEFKIVATGTDNVFNIYNTITNTSIACQEGGNIYTEDGNSDFSVAEASQATVNVSIAADVKYATRIFPFAPELPEGVKAYTCDATKEILELTEVVTPEANVPYILVAEEGCASTDLKGWGVLSSLDPKAGGDDNHLTGVYTAQKAPKDSYVLQNQNDKVAFYLVAENGEPTVGAYRCYLTAPSNVESRAAFYFDKNETTAIRAIEALTSGDAEIFNAAGARVPVLQKGVNIVKRNDKSYKVIVK